MGLLENMLKPPGNPSRMRMKTLTPGTKPTGNEKHYEAERALVKAADEPCDRYPGASLNSSFEHDRRRDVCAFMAGV
jgi:hypothetical protein